MNIIQGAHLVWKYAQTRQNTYFDMVGDIYLSEYLVPNEF